MDHQFGQHDVAAGICQGGNAGQLRFVTGQFVQAQDGRGGKHGRDPGKDSVGHHSVDARGAQSA
ncbi:hypothetical protein LBMAG46_31080 [Planctomycetia bacterium]|nr:hypothetical protein LBMAG46_31080 [Planctomycetia bacterium]